MRCATSWCWSSSHCSSPSASTRRRLADPARDAPVDRSDDHVAAAAPDRRRFHRLGRTAAVHRGYEAGQGSAELPQPASATRTATAPSTTGSTSPSGHQLPRRPGNRLGRWGAGPGDAGLRRDLQYADRAGLQHLLHGGPAADAAGPGAGLPAFAPTPGAPRSPTWWSTRSART